MGLDLPTVTPGVMKEVGEVEVNSIHYNLFEEISVIRELNVLLISLTLSTMTLNYTFSSQWSGTPFEPLV